MTRKRSSREVTVGKYSELVKRYAKVKKELDYAKDGWRTCRSLYKEQSEQFSSDIAYLHSIIQREIQKQIRLQNEVDSLETMLGKVLKIGER